MATRVIFDVEHHRNRCASKYAKNGDNGCLPEKALVKIT
jgi:hypothetical protein